MSHLHLVPATAAQEAFRLDCLKLLERHLEENTAEALLAIAAQLLGQIIAVQDSRIRTRAEVMEIVLANIEAGNKRAVEAVIAASGGRQ